MKNLEEKKLLLKMMRMFGQEDKELAESIQREEELAKFFFKESAPEPELVVESSPINEVIVPTPEPAPAFTPPTTNTVVDVVNVLKSANVANANTNVYRDKEMEGMRKTIAEMMQKISTMSWGGGGTGIVRIFDADDFDRNSVGEGDHLFHIVGINSAAHCAGTPRRAHPRPHAQDGNGASARPALGHACGAHQGRRIL